VDIGKSIAKETRTIEQAVLEIWPSQVHVPILCVFVF
jgi:hypothetical protein